MDKLLISVSGIRGIVGQSLTPEVVMHYARGFGRFIEGGAVVIGRDTRYHGPMLAAAAAAGLMSAGCDVLDIGVVTTPTAEFAVKRTGSAGGVVITASHNPIEYNALKLIGSRGMFLTESESKKYLRVVERKAKARSRYGRSNQEDGWDIKHVESILDLDIVAKQKIKKARFKVVADCVNGTASFVAAELFGSLDCRLKLINAVPDGRFPRPPEPTAENLDELCHEVKRLGADIGFAFDPDSDRLAIVDETGKPLGEEYTLALGLRYILSKKKGPVAVNLSSSMMNDWVAREAGVKIYRTKVGEVNVSEKLIQAGGVAGGEGNGGLIYPGIHYGRDALQAAAIILSYMAARKLPISKIAGELPRTFMVKKKIAVPKKGINPQQIRKNFKAGKIDLRDGIKLVFDDYWFQVRLSNTEPVARIMAESYDPEKAEELADAVEKMLT